MRKSVIYIPPRKKRWHWVVDVICVVSGFIAGCILVLNFLLG